MIAKIFFTRFNVYMRIDSIQNIKFYQTNINTKKITAPQTDAKTTELPVFKGSFPLAQYSQKFYKARAYLDTKEIINSGFKKTEITDFDLNLLDGIQEGIKVFKGLNMKEIAFIAQTITETTIIRGCHNRCFHCYAGGKPPIREDEKHINKMSWNDFESLTEGFSELNKRLGFPITRNHKNQHPYMTMFHDADCIDIVLTDNQGMEHDFIDISNRLAKAFRLKNIFDTAGWSPRNKKAQARAEKYAGFYKNPKNKNGIILFNLSINPYHILHVKEVELENLKEIERAKNFRDLYTTRMANVLFTFTPLIKKGKLTFIHRASANDSKGTEGFQERDLRKLDDEIFEKLKVMYQNDYNGERKYIKGEFQIDRLINSCRIYLSYIDTRPLMTPSLEKIYSPQDNTYKYSQQRKRQDIEDIKKAKNIQDILYGKDGYSKYSGILDANGRYYLTDFYLTIPTELNLNFENKDKLTAPIEPYLQNDLVITKRIINTINKP